MAVISWVRLAPGGYDSHPEAAEQFFLLAYLNRNLNSFELNLSSPYFLNPFFCLSPSHVLRIEGRSEVNFYSRSSKRACNSVGSDRVESLARVRLDPLQRCRIEDGE